MHASGTDSMSLNIHVSSKPNLGDQQAFTSLTYSFINWKLAVEVTYEYLPDGIFIHCKRLISL